MRIRPGNALPLAIMMTTLMLLAGFGLGLVVVDQSRRSVETDQAVQSYYMAYSGVETQLFLVRKRNFALSQLEYASTYYSGTQSYLNGGSWKSTTDLVKVSSKKVTLVKESQFTNMDLYDPDNAAVASNVCKLTVTWSDDPESCPVGSNSMLEASYGYWTVDAGGPQWPLDNQFVIMTKSIQGNKSVLPVPIPFLPMTITGLSPDKAYRIRLRAYNCNAKDVLIQAYGEDPNTGLCDKTDFNFPGDLSLSAQGSYILSNQQVTVTMPKQDVLSGVFGYVLFSECSIVKGTGAVVCP